MSHGWFSNITAMPFFRRLIRYGFAIAFFVCFVITESMGAAESSTVVIFDMDSIKHRAGEGTGPGGQKVPMGTLELVEGKVGHAVQFCFTNIGPGFMTAPVRPSAEWNAAEGFSFLLKGD